MSKRSKLLAQKNRLMQCRTDSKERLLVLEDNSDGVIHTSQWGDPQAEAIAELEEDIEGFELMIESVQAEIDALGEDDFDFEAVENCLAEIFAARTSN